MTEDEWLACGDHSTMLAFLDEKGAGGFRKYRLLLVAYCRTFLPVLMANEQTRHAVEAAEAYADGTMVHVEVARAKRAALKAVERQPRLDLAVRGVTHGLPKRQAVEFPFFCLRPWRTSNYNRPTPAQGRSLAQLIRDIFGNPFRSVILNPAWLTAGVVGLALALASYSNRAFDHLPILADALEEAGCNESTILDHCRQPGEHVRGCWVVDLVLGKM